MTVHGKVIMYMIFDGPTTNLRKSTKLRIHLLWSYFAVHFFALTEKLVHLVPGAQLGEIFFWSSFPNSSLLLFFHKLISTISTIFKLKLFKDECCTMYMYIILSNCKCKSSHLEIISTLNRNRFSTMRAKMIWTHFWRSNHSYLYAPAFSRDNPSIFILSEYVLRRNVNDLLVSWIFWMKFAYKNKNAALKRLKIVPDLDLNTF